MLLHKKTSVRYFVNEIKYQILIICVFAVVIGLLDAHPIFRSLMLPLSIPALVGTVVSLLLAFRTSQSYERWWEARSVWGAIVNDSRTFVRQVIQFLPEGNETEIKAFAQRQVIWTYALGESLRRLPFSGKVQEYLDGQGISAANIPNALLDQHSLQIKSLVAKGTLSEFRQIQLDKTVGRLCDSMGKCERIKNTAFPWSYSVLVHTIIYVFAILLPFGLEDSQQIVEILLTILLPSLFLAIEKTAIIMQDPFENTPVDTPMTTLAETIEMNIRQMTGEKNVSKKPDDGLYYQL